MKALLILSPLGLMTLLSVILTPTAWAAWANEEVGVQGNSQPDESILEANPSSVRLPSTVSGSAESTVETSAEPNATRLSSPQSHAEVHPPISPLSDSPTSRPATTVTDWVAQIEASQVQITGVRLEPTETGLSIVLETAAGDLPTPTTQTVGNALTADIPNAVLALPEGEMFEQFGPAEGIALVSVMNMPDGGVRVSITGADAPPQAEVSMEAGNLVLSVASGVATAMDTEEDAIELVVTATRTEEEITDQPRSVTVIDREEIEQQAQVSRNLPDILSQTVPGFFSTAQGANTNFQNIRGRPPQVLIDGVPTTSNLSTVQPRDLRSIDPSAVERIEVVRGPSALYGDGGTGGVVNIITRDRTQEKFTARSQVAVDVATTGDEDNVGNFFSQFIAFNEGDFDFTFTLSREYTGSFFDAEGDRIFVDDSFETSNRETLNVLVKLGVDLSEEQRLQLTVNRFDDDQVIANAPDPNILDTPGIQKVVGVERERQYIGLPEPEVQNTVVNLNYTHENLLNSRVQAQAYYRDNQYISSIFDGRELGLDPAVYSSDYQREQLGTRLQVETPFSSELSLLWGADYSDENISETRLPVDEEEFNESGGEVLRKIDEFTFIPPYDFTSLGLFAQLQWDLSERWALSGGLRHAQLGLSVDDYTADGLGFRPDREIEGGEIDFNDTLFNVGIVYDLTDEVNLFASFSQGFSAPDFGRLLRFPPEGFTSLEEDLDLTRPQKVDSYELGVRSNWQNVQVSLAGFYNESELGVRTEFVAEARGARISRVPKRFYGLEASLDWQPGGGWGLGGNVSWTEGEFENEEGDFLPITSREISPLKLTAYVENETQSGWRNRLQAQYIGSRDRAFEEEVDPVPIESFLTVDFISSIPLWGGQLELRVGNLLNEQYFPVFNQVAGQQVETSNFAARGRTIQLGYSIEW